MWTCLLALVPYMLGMTLIMPEIAQFMNGNSHHINKATSNIPSNVLEEPFATEQIAQITSSSLEFEPRPFRYTLVDPEVDITPY